MIPDIVRKDIFSRIREAEREHNVKVIYAVESGSRAWGFASPNSDYDVRFIYLRPHDWYLTLDVEDRRDVIEYPIVDEIDINGWDIRKALKLLWRSNPAIVEWLQSPIVYLCDGEFAPAARALVASVYSVERGIYHYRHMARNNYREHFQTDAVVIKKYFYVLRAILSIMWLEKYQQPAPIEFHRLRELIGKGTPVDVEIAALLERKKLSQEKEIAAPIAVLNDFIEQVFEDFTRRPMVDTPPQSDMSGLNNLFKAMLAKHSTTLG